MVLTPFPPPPPFLPPSHDKREEIFIDYICGGRSRQDLGEGLRLTKNDTRLTWKLSDYIVIVLCFDCRGRVLSEIFNIFSVVSLWTLICNFYLTGSFLRIQVFNSFIISTFFPYTISVRTFLYVVSFFFFP